jgi:ATP-dependent RNA helicase DeaD
MNTLDDAADLLGPALTGALAERGFSALTAVQEAVLDPGVEGRDLRISSQTGSGKTVAIGLLIRHVDYASVVAQAGVALPRAIVIAPTRELAKQVEAELTWLLAPLGAKVVSVIGGSSARDERRLLGRGAGVVVGTPGRLLDHLERGAIDPRAVQAVVLDEADQMLDLGFREDLEAILGKLPVERRTHLVSATFPRMVLALADGVQRDPLRIEATRHGEANADIEHLIHLVDPDDRLAAVVNLLLAHPDEQALVFARTRADVAALAELLREAGFPVLPLSGDLEQHERERALGAFRAGTLRALVATDVAARGIDVQGVARVIQVDPPSHAETYTHRSGRTGRAGRAGKSSILVPPSAVDRTVRILRRAGVRPSFAPIPSAAEIRDARDQSLEQELLGEPTAEENIPDRTWALAKRLAQAPVLSRVLARLLHRMRASGVGEPRELRHIELREVPRERPMPERGRRGERPIGRGYGQGYDEPRTRAPYTMPPPGPSREERPRPAYDRGAADRVGHERTSHDRVGHERGARAEYERPSPARHDEERVREPRARAPRDAEGGGSWVAFDVSWGEVHGADARRMMAMMCRRGAVRGSDIGAIRLGPTRSQVEVSAAVADAFERAAAKPDPRDPRVRIQRAGAGHGPPRKPRR